MARRTAIIEKVGPKPGVYRVVKNGSTREVDSFSPERLRRIAETGQAMIDAGLKIPVPAFHFDEAGVAPTPFVVTENGEELDPVTGKKATWNSTDNFGFIKAFFVNEEGALVQVIESYGDENDLNTPAGKLGTTVQEISLGLASVYTDGAGNVWKDAPIHSAACIKGVEPDQSNFTLVQEKLSGLQLVTMSSLLMPTGVKTMAAQGLGAAAGSNLGEVEDSDDKTDDSLGGESVSGNLPQVLQLLRSLEPPIDLPADTSEDNFIAYLAVALLQHKSLSKSGAFDSQSMRPKPPKGAQEKTSSGFTQMSNTTQQSNSTPAPSTPVQATPDPLTLTLLSIQAGTQRTAVEDRAKALIAKGVPQAWVDAHVTPALGFDVKTMSADMVLPTGKLKPIAAVEALLDGVEAALASKLTSMSAQQVLGADSGYFGAMPEGSREHAQTSSGEMSKEDAEQAANDIAGLSDF